MCLHQAGYSMDQDHEEAGRNSNRSGADEDVEVGIFVCQAADRQQGEVSIVAPPALQAK